MMARFLPAIKSNSLRIGLFVAVFAAVFISRDTRLHGSGAVVVPETIELLLYEPAGLNTLMDELSQNGVEIDEEEMSWASAILGWRRFRSGRYLLSGNYSYDDLLSAIARGNEDHVSVTVAPGLDVARLSRILANYLRADSSEFADVFRDSSSLALELGLKGQVLFSRMLPDTYNIYWTTSAEGVVKRIYNEFEQRVTDRYSTQISDNSLNLNEIVTLASIVEWEAKEPEEKPIISGLYLNRLNRNMYLQADPTVIFAIGERRRLLYEDYKFDHPYNTYLNSGLPPGPITNPDLSSIESVLDPAAHDYLYMVASSDGGHVFSRTYEEHIRASDEWQEWIREQYRIRDENERRESDRN